MAYSQRALTDRQRIGHVNGDIKAGLHQVDCIRTGAVKGEGLVTKAPFQIAGKVTPVRQAKAQRHATDLIGQLIDAGQVQASEQALLRAVADRQRILLLLQHLLAIIVIEANAVAQVNAWLQAEFAVQAEVAAQRQRWTQGPAFILALGDARALKNPAVVVVDAVAEVQDTLQIWVSNRCLRPLFGLYPVANLKLSDAACLVFNEDTDRAHALDDDAARDIQAGAGHAGLILNSNPV